VLGADRAVARRDDVVDDPVHLLPAREIGGLVHAGRLAQVEMDVAVPDMPERNRADAGNGARHGRARLDDEIGDAAYRYRDVVLDAAALVALCLGHAVADAPELAGLRGAGGDDAIDDQP